MLRKLALIVFAVLVCSQKSQAATQGGVIPVPLPLFPPTNWWNLDISGATVDPNSASFIQMIGTAKTLHIDAGGDLGGGLFAGMPFIIVDGNQPKKTVTFGDPSESDGVGAAFYPIPDEAITMSGWIENGEPGNVDTRTAEDRHMLIVDSTNNTLYELYNVYYASTGWQALSGAFFDMKTDNRRPETWISASGSGLAILPGVLRYEEVAGSSEIGHALRVSLSKSYGHVYPASRTYGMQTIGAAPLGARLRLKASKDISTYSADMQKIFRAMKKYGLIASDLGTDMRLTGTADTQWNATTLKTALLSLNANDFEVVLRGWPPTPVLSLPDPSGSGDLTDGTLSIYDPAQLNLLADYRGTVQFSSSDAAATLPPNYSFTAADAGRHIFSGGFTMRTPGTQTVVATDTANGTITTTTTIVVGPRTPAGLVATATTPTNINVIWNSSPGATQYEVGRWSTINDPSPVITAASSSFTDTTPTAGRTYIYAVRAIDSASRPSPWSARDIATTVIFTDDPVIARTTPIKAIHVTELQQAAAAMLMAAVSGNPSFTTRSPGMPVSMDAIADLRNVITGSRSMLHVAPVTFTDPTLSRYNTIVRAIHIDELRAAVK